MTSTPNAFVSMDHLRRWARSALLAAFAIVVGSVALGEQGGSGVQVDLSVLEEMGPRKPLTSTDRIVVKRPGEAGPGQAARPARASVRPTQPTAAPPKPTPRGAPALGDDFPAMRASDEPIDDAIEAASDEEIAAAEAEAAQDVAPPAEEPVSPPAPVEEATESAETVPVETEVSDEPDEEAAVVEDAAAEDSPAVTEPLETVQVETRPALGPADEVESGEEAEDESTEAVAEQAARPPIGEDGAGSLRVLFKPGSADLSDEADDALDTLADRMNDNPALRVELLAYAPADEVEERLARRLSLSRALAIRLFLTEEGIAGTRTLVRALGGRADEGPADRVDVVLAGQ